MLPLIGGASLKLLGGIQLTRPANPRPRSSNHACSPATLPGARPASPRGGRAPERPGPQIGCSPDSQVDASQGCGTPVVPLDEGPCEREKRTHLGVTLCKAVAPSQEPPRAVLLTHRLEKAPLCAGLPAIHSQPRGLSALPPSASKKPHPPAKIRCANQRTGELAHESFVVAMPGRPQIQTQEWTAGACCQTAAAGACRACRVWSSGEWQAPREGGWKGCSLVEAFRARAATIHPPEPRTAAWARVAPIGRWKANEAEHSPRSPRALSRYEPGVSAGKTGAARGVSRGAPRRHASVGQVGAPPARLRHAGNAARRREHRQPCLPRGAPARSLLHFAAPTH